jgi:hypothetical protein
MNDRKMMTGQRLGPHQCRHSGSALVDPTHEYYLRTTAALERQFLKVPAIRLKSANASASSSSTGTLQWFLHGSCVICFDIVTN